MTYADEVLADLPWGFWEQLESSGATLADASGNARNLAITGAPTLAQTGPDGANDAILWPSSVGSEHYAYSAVTVNTAVCTLEAWVFLSALPTSNTPIIGTAAAYGSNTQRINMFVGTDGAIRFMTYTGGVEAAVLAANTALTLGVWHHVVASIGAAGTKIRVDKTTAGTTGATSVSAGAELVFLRGGGSSPNGRSFIDGSPIKIAYPAFYTTQLSDTRTDAHADAIGGSVAVPVGQAAQASTAQPVVPAVTAVPVGRATEVDTANVTTPVVSAGAAIGAAAETDIALSVAPAGGVSAVAVGEAEEIDIAIILSALSAFVVEHDAFATAQELGGLTGSTDFDTLGATFESGEPNSELGAGSVWFVWTAPDYPGLVEFSTTGDVNLAIYTGDDFATLVSVATNPFEYVEGETYRIQVITLSGDPATTQTLSWDEATPEYYDDHDTPLEIADSYGYQEMTTDDSTLEAGEPDNGDRSSWVRWTATEDGKVLLTFRTDGTFTVTRFD